jgi:aminoglycoside phosphotransferase (APT) family kinase protein
LLARCAPELRAVQVSFIGEGWEFWGYRAGDYVLRVPKQPGKRALLELESRVLPELAGILPAPISTPVMLLENEANSAPIGVYSHIEGAAASRFEGRIAPGFGAAFRRFVRALHSFSVERAAELGVKLVTGSEARRERELKYEEARRRVFPIVGAGTRAYLEHGFETSLRDPGSFDFRSAFVHRDLDGHAHVLINSRGELAGVIDFSDMVVGNPAVDLWMPLREFESLGIASQTNDALQAYGLDPADLPAVQREIEWLALHWSYAVIPYALDIGDMRRLEEGLRELQAKAAEAGFR